MDWYGTIYVGSADKNLYAINPDGSEKWHVTLGDAIGAPPVLSADETVYVGCNDGKLYAVNSEGAVDWEFATGGAIYATAAIAGEAEGGVVYVGSTDRLPLCRRSCGQRSMAVWRW